MVNQMLAYNVCSQSNAQLLTGHETTRCWTMRCDFSVQAVFVGLNLFNWDKLTALDPKISSQDKDSCVQ